MSGHISLVGIGGGTFPMAFGTLPLEWSLGQAELGLAPRACTRSWRSRAPDRSIEVERFALEEAVEGYRRLKGGDVDGRAVVLP